MISLRKDLRGIFSIPDAREDIGLWYSEQEIEGGEHLRTCNETGDVTVGLKDGRTAVLYSIDLD